MRLNIKGMITNDDDANIYRDWLGMSVTSPADVLSKLPDDGSDLEIAINSGGGEVDAANEIYTGLRNYQGRVIIQVESSAYSAASIIAMAGDTVQISPVAQLMIHNASTYAGGNHNDLDKTSNALKSTDKAIAKAYAVKTGRPVDEFLAMMDKETWINADDAIELGLADEIMTFETEPVTNSISNVLPRKTINRIKDLVNENKELKNNKTDSQPSEHDKLVQAKLAILRK
ncbi:ATP-dependent Clp protease proteolytic subunit [Leuconostoc kimchii IMSNU 11154]|uniref:ATP-dependent Clp protease proteolytic subunit n=1 Tax=Leuconostoc kimchii (strain IMSNU 11154 / KCTC 2386 / IH25) TaxID=762051 RepID=D5T0V2_LEUKI|nr:head maturation protease, ClpP-related [Leuconostoc kimchii]ADG39901.1 ATP-dependent Clp protease proteolytic subunit [Leuconostoc kimchii IMSNU 11154]